MQSQLGSSGSTFYGSDKAGSVSVNGGRGRANNFSVNGGDANDQFVNAAAVQPTPDAIEEFRVITNTFDAEYGRNSGAVVNVVTKSGTNALHGNVYEYFRNKVLNAQGYFNTVKPQFNQNQFGGTLGGPIKKDRTFFFGSYEGRRVRKGDAGPISAVPTAAGDLRRFQRGDAPFGGTINDTVRGRCSNGRTDGTTTCAQAIPTTMAPPLPRAPTGPLSFPTASSPLQCMDPVAQNLLQYLPAANLPGGQYQGVPTESDNQDQFTVRVDHRINDRQNLSVYYYFTDESDHAPFYGFQASGANVPGYRDDCEAAISAVESEPTWTINNSLVNESAVHLPAGRPVTFQHPQTTGAVQSFCTGSAASFCFNGTSDSSAVNAAITAAGIAPGKAGITTGLPSNRTGLPFVTVSGGFNIGNGWEGELPQVGNSFQCLPTASAG